MRTIMDRLHTVFMGRQPWVFAVVGNGSSCLGRLNIVCLCRVLEYKTRKLHC